MGQKYVIHTYEAGSSKPSGKTKAHSTLAGAVAEAKQKSAGIVGGDDSSKKTVLAKKTPLKKGPNNSPKSQEKGVHKEVPKDSNFPKMQTKGRSIAGQLARQGGSQVESSKARHAKNLEQLKAMPKPNLTKDDPDEEQEDTLDGQGGDETGTEERRPDVSAKVNLAAPEAGEEDADTDSGEPNIADGDADPEITDEETGDGNPADNNGLPNDQDPNQEAGEQAVPSEEEEPGEGEEQVPDEEDPDGALQDDSIPTDGEAPAKDGEVPDDDQLPDVDGADGNASANDQANDQVEDQVGGSPGDGSGMTYIAGDGDNIGQEVGQSVLADDVEALHEVSQRINQGQNMVMDWAEQNGGRVISAGGDEFVLEMPQGCDPQALEDLRGQYQQAVGATLTLGCGNSMSEAGKALIAGKLQGKDQVVQYDPSVEDKLFSTHQNPGGDPEAQKQDEHYLGSAYGGQGNPDQQSADQDAIQDDPAAADDDTGYFQGADGTQPSSQGSAIDNGVGDQDPDAPIKPEDAIDAVAQGAQQQGADGDKGEMDEAEGDEPGMDDVMADQTDRAGGENIKSKLAEILQAYRSDQSFIEDAKQTNPDLYRECMTLLQQMMKVARMVKPAPQGQPGQPPGQQPADAPPEDGKAVPNVAADQGIGSAGGAGGPPPKKPQPQA
jgi:hypothetical protein